MATKSPRNVEAVGPTQTAGGDPPNPQDRLFAGALPTYVPPQTTVRRPFTEPVRPPLHYADGPGPDEAVTSRQAPPAPLDDSHSVLDHKELRPIQGKSVGIVPNTTHTTNGIEIRGT